jgi:hypothetical protein
MVGAFVLAQRRALAPGPPDSVAAEDPGARLRKRADFDRDASPCGWRGFGGRARFMAAWLLPFLGTMLRLGDALADALHARGYAPGMRRTALPRERWAMADTILVLTGVVAAGVLIRGV